MKKILAALFVAALVSACSSPEENKAPETTQGKDNKGVYTAQIKEMTDGEYPDNPDISIRHKIDGQFSHTEVTVQKGEAGYDFVLLPGNFESDTIVFSNVNMMEYMPSAPKWVKGDDYLTYVTIINQEWNRQQVKYFPGQFEIKGSNLESKSLKRIDLARNCLNAYLWEVIGYAEKEDGGLAPAYHGWFNFPKELYAQLFDERNDLSYEDFRKPLEDWVTPEFKEIDFSLLRDVKEEKELAFESFNDQLYPLVGERKKKNPNIVRPKEVAVINDFLNDSTQYATFSIPGYYNTKDPRKTELSRLSILEKAFLKDIKSKNEAGSELKELELTFKRSTSEERMKFTIGGLDLAQIDTLSLETHSKGFQMPMGVANHSFYESYDRMIENTSYQNPFYALLTDGEGKFMDSHHVGIDGPLFWINAETGKLHLMILSFERHSFVGHFAFEL